MECDIAADRAHLIAGDGDAAGDAAAGNINGGLMDRHVGRHAAVLDVNRDVFRSPVGIPV